MRKLRWLIYVQPLNRIILFVVLLVTVWSIFGSRADKLKWWKIFNAIIFLLGFVAVAYMTVGTREAGSHEVVLTPFQSFIEAKEQPEIYRSMLMNIFLFVPLGLSLPNVLPKKWSPVVNVIVVIMFGLCLSVTIEWCQYQYGLGRCEVDDVIMNSIGTAIGASSYIVARIMT